ncbi:MAG: CpsB/CapC family capsule biosynthesis tyrosine phosphatase [Muribaculaceae bacterium]
MLNFFHKSSKKDTLFYTTDIHSHVVPGIDDGSQNVETSLFLIRKMMEWGITRILATPHVTMSTFENTPPIITAAFEKLKTALADNKIDIEIGHSAEYRVDGFFENIVKNNEIFLLPNNHILVENSFLQEPWQLDEMLFDLKLKGYSPILAHPERYKYYMSKPSRYAELHDSDTLFQVNLLSFAGYYGKEVKNMAEWLLENKMIDFIGTDLHNIKHVESITHYLTTKEYRKLAEKADIQNDTAFL